MIYQYTQVKENHILSVLVFQVSIKSAKQPFVPLLSYMYIISKPYLQHYEVKVFSFPLWAISYWVYLPFNELQ